MQETPATRHATLSTGAVVPLIPAARALGCLQDHLDLPEAEWDVVYHLRELCLDHPIEPEQLRTLVNAGVATKDGEVEPTMKAVVLSSVRGSGRTLHLDCPFVERVDQRIAEFVVARDYLEVQLEQGGFDRLLEETGEVRDIQRQLEEIPLPPGLQDTAGFADRIRRQAQKRQDGGSTPEANEPDGP